MQVLLNKGPRFVRIPDIERVRLEEGDAVLGVAALLRRGNFSISLRGYGTFLQILH